MSHTKGEWFYYDKAIQTTDGDNDTYIAWIQYPFTDEGEANARLIAAAPDLLAACEKLASLNCTDGYSLFDGQYAILWDALDAARDAIKKTKGETE